MKQKETLAEKRNINERKGRSHLQLRTNLKAGSDPAGTYTVVVEQPGAAPDTYTVTIP